MFPLSVTKMKCQRLKSAFGNKEETYGVPVTTDNAADSSSQLFFPLDYYYIISYYTRLKKSMVVKSESHGLYSHILPIVHKHLIEVSFFLAKFTILFMAATFYAANLFKQNFWRHYFLSVTFNFTTLYKTKQHIIFLLLYYSLLSVYTWSPVKSDPLKNYVRHNLNGFSVHDKNLNFDSFNSFDTNNRRLFDNFGENENRIISLSLNSQPARTKKAINSFNLSYSLVKNSGKPCFPMDSCERPDILNEESNLNLRKQSASHKRLKNCECDADCVIYGDCCADFYSIDAPDNAKIDQKEEYPKFSCKHVSGLYDIYMVDECSSALLNNHNLKVKCHATDFKDPLTFIPYTDSRTNFTYRNIFCALCNNDPSILPSLVPWASTINCDFSPAFPANNKLSSLTTESFLAHYLNPLNPSYSSLVPYTFQYDSHQKFLVWRFPHEFFDSKGQVIRGEKNVSNRNTGDDGGSTCWWKFSHPSMTIITNSRKSFILRDTSLDKGTDGFENNAIGLRKCVPKVIDDCYQIANDTSVISITSGYSWTSNETKESLRAKCRAYTARVWSPAYVYKNTHCALCNGGQVKALSELSCYDVFSSPDPSNSKKYKFNNDHLYSKYGLSLPPTLTFSWKLMSDGNLADPLRKCLPGNIWDPFKSLCIKLHYCAKGTAYDESSSHPSCVQMSAEEIARLASYTLSTLSSENSLLDPNNFIFTTLNLNENNKYVLKDIDNIINSLGDVIPCMNPNEINSALSFSYRSDRNSLTKIIASLDPDGSRFTVWGSDNYESLDTGKQGPHSIRLKASRLPPSYKIYLDYSALVNPGEYYYLVQGTRNPRYNGGENKHLLSLLSLSPSDLKNGQRLAAGKKNDYYSDNVNSSPLFVCTETLISKFRHDDPFYEKKGGDYGLNGPARDFVCKRKRIVSYLALLISSAICVSTVILSLVYRCTNKKWNDECIPSNINILAVNDSGKKRRKMGNDIINEGRIKKLGIALEIQSPSDTNRLLMSIHSLECALLNALLVLAMFYYYHDLSPSLDSGFKSSVDHYYPRCLFSPNQHMYSHSLDNSSLVALNKTYAKHIPMVITETLKLGSEFSLKFIQPFIIFCLFSNLFWLVAFCLNRFFGALQDYRDGTSDHYSGAKFQENNKNYILDRNEGPALARRHMSYDFWNGAVSSKLPWLRYLVFQCSVWILAFLTTALFYSTIVISSSNTFLTPDFSHILRDGNNGSSNYSNVKRYLFLTVLDVSPLYAPRHNNSELAEFYSRSSLLQGNGDLCQACSSVPLINPFFGLSFLLPLTLCTVSLALILSLSVICLKTGNLWCFKLPSCRSNVAVNKHNPLKCYERGKSHRNNKRNGTSHDKTADEFYSSPPHNGSLLYPKLTGNNINEFNSNTSSSTNSYTQNNEEDHNVENNYDRLINSEKSQRIDAKNSGETSTSNSGSTDDNFTSHDPLNKKQPTLPMRNSCYSDNKNTMNYGELNFSDIATILLIIITLVQYALLSASSTLNTAKSSSRFSHFLAKSDNIYWILYLVFTLFRSLYLFTRAAIELNYSSSTAQALDDDRALDKSKFADSNNKYLSPKFYNPLGTNKGSYDVYFKQNLLNHSSHLHTPCQLKTDHNNNVELLREKLLDNHLANNSPKICNSTAAPFHHNNDDAYYNNHKIYGQRPDRFMELALEQEKARLHSVRDIEIL
ncbi:unnamed protein product [Gordionus sp. m RMFG-2023]